jgi:hypothetical protein
MMGRIGEVNSFGLLHTFAVDGSGLPDGEQKTELMRAIEHRALALFSVCDSMPSVKEGLQLHQFLGRPRELAIAGNAAYNRFRGAQQ